MEEKKLYYSKTFWFSILTFAAGFVPVVKEFMVSQPEAFGIVWGFAALVLRLVTKGGVKLLD